MRPECRGSGGRSQTGRMGRPLLRKESATVKHFWWELECLEPRILLDSAPIVLWTALNDGNSQRSTLARIEVGFDADVGESLSVDDLVLTHADGTVVDLAGASFSYDAGTRAATWDLIGLPAERLPDGFYRAGLLSAGISDGAGRKLDGNRDGTGGDDYEFGLFRMSGDTNGDGSVNDLDRRAVLDNWLKPAGQFDVHADANGDGAVNVHDLLAVRRNWQRSVEPPVRLDKAQGPDELAAALLYRPEKIYEHVLNTIRYEPYAGSMKGAAATLRTRAGNAWDQSALLVAALDEAGVYARFASAQVDADPQQVMDWLGVKDPAKAAHVLANAQLGGQLHTVNGEPVSVHFDHAWVEAFLPEAGASHGWKDMDPSWKFRDFREGVENLLADVPFDEAGFLSEPRIELPFEYYENQVAAYLTANVPGVSLADVGYNGPIIPRRIDAIDGVLAYELESGQQPTTHNRVPLWQTHRVRLRLTDSSGGSEYFNHLLVLPEMSLRRVTVGPADAGDGRVRPQLMLDGEVVAESSSTLSPGTSISLHIDHLNGDGDNGVDRTDVYEREAARYIAVGLDAGQISEGMLNSLQQTINNASLAELAGEAVDSDDLIGAYLARGVLGYFHETRRAERIVTALTEGLALYKRVASGLTTGERTVQYFEQLQNPYRPDDLALDVANSVYHGFTIDGDDSLDAARRRLVMHNKSAQEHAIWEEVAQTESISTIKSLQLAHQRGIPVHVIPPYHPLPRVPGDVRPSIQGYVNSGWTVTVPEEDTPLNDWDGVGYIAERDDGDVWEAAYIISGGLNSSASEPQSIEGGYITGLPLLFPFLWLLPWHWLVGDPINIANGNVTHDELDVQIPGAGLGLDFSRHYDSVSETDVGFGPGWVHSYSDFLTVNPDDSVVWSDGGGFQYLFEPDGQGGYVVPDVLRGGTFTESGGEHTYRAKDGLRRTFDTEGRLAEIRDRNDNVIRLTHDDDGRLVEVIDDDAPHRKLTLAYTGDRIASLSDFTGRTWTYGRTGDGRLASVTTPSDAVTPAYTTGYDYYGEGALEGLLHRVTRADGGVVTYEYYTNRRGFRVTDPEGNSHHVSYNAYRGRTAFTDERGFTTLHRYDEKGYLVEQIHPDGAIESWTWTDGLKTSHTDVFGLAEGYEHDGAGNVTKILDRAGSTFSFTYEPVYNRPTRSAMPDGRVTEFAYDASGNMLSLTDALGHTTSMSHDSRGMMVTFTDALGKTTSRSYDAAGLLLTVTDPLGGISTFSYDAAGNRVSETDANGNVGTYTYDLLNRLLTVTDPLGNLTSSTYTPLAGPDTITDALGRETESVYDHNQQLVRVIDPDHGTWLAEYDPAGNQTVIADPAGRETRSEYDWLGRRTATVHPDGSVSRTHYDGKGRPVAVIDETGHATTYAYDALDRLVAVTDPLGNVTTYSYDPIGNRIGQSDPLGNVTTYTYDLVDRQTGVSDALGNTTVLDYDAVGNLIAVTDPLGRTTGYGYDFLGRLLTETDPMGNVSTYAYDPVGNRISETDPLGNVTTCGYDNLDRTVSATNELGGTTTMGYDAVGNLTWTTDPEANTTSYAYDLMDRLVAETNELGDSRTYCFDPIGNRISATDRNGRTREFVYDLRDRIVEERWLDSGGAVTHTIRQTYDAAGRALALADTHASYEYAYDAAGRLTSVVAGFGSAPPPIVYDYAGKLEPGDFTFGDGSYYDPYVFDAEVGDTITVTMRSTELDAYLIVQSPTGSQWGDDNSGGGSDAQVELTAGEAGSWLVAANTWAGMTGAYTLCIEVARTDALVVLEYAYDANDDLTMVSDSLGGTTVHTYDAVGQRVQTTQFGPGVAEKRVDFAYLADGQFHTVGRYADLAGTADVATSSYAYDGAGRLIALSHTHGPTTLADYTWSWDAVNRITQMTSVDGTSDYALDAVDQLIAADHDFQADEGYTYDTTGNRTNAGYVTGPNNRLLADGTYTYEYDAEGNRIRRAETATGVVTEYEWDHRNRLTHVVTRDATANVTEEVRYSYDASDRRVHKWVDADGAGPETASEEQFVYDGLHIAVVLDGHGAVISRHLHGPAVDQVIAEERAGGSVFWSLGDHQYTVRDVVDSVGVVVNHLTYDSFGQITDQTDPSVALRFSYTGREFDAETGLYYYRARHYDAAVGRFVSEDPIRFGGGDVNLYRYAGNRPLVFRDPDGLKSITVIEKAKGWDGYLIGSRLFNSWFAPSVGSVKDLVSTVTKKAGNSRIRRLDIIGHGNSGGQRIGQDFLSLYSLTSHEAELKKLAPYFTDDAVVTLHGCNVGRNDQLLKDLSKALGGVKVRAGTPYQNAFWGIEGGERICGPDNCTYTGPGFWDWYYGRQDKKEAKKAAKKASK